MESFRCYSTSPSWQRRTAMGFKIAFHVNFISWNWFWSSAQSWANMVCKDLIFRGYINELKYDVKARQWVTILPCPAVCVALWTVIRLDESWQQARSVRSINFHQNLLRKIDASVTWNHHQTHNLTASNDQSVASFWLGQNSLIRADLDMSLILLSAWGIWGKLNNGPHASLLFWGHLDGLHELL